MGSVPTWLPEEKTGTWQWLALPPSGCTVDQCGGCWINATTIIIIKRHAQLKRCCCNATKHSYLIQTIAAQPS
jgi:hypothetical protein